jgi:hypothetical protein
MLAEPSCHLLVQLADLLLDQLQLLQEHLEQSAVDGFELRARPARRITVPVWHATSYRPKRPGRPDRFLHPRSKHASCTDAQKIRDQIGQLNVGLFQ